MKVFRRGNMVATDPMKRYVMTETGSIWAVRLAEALVIDNSKGTLEGCNSPEKVIHVGLNYIHTRKPR